MVQPAPGPAPQALCGTAPYVIGLRFGAARIAADLIGCGLEEDVRRTRQIKRTAHGGQQALGRQLAAPSRQARGPTTRSSRAVVCARTALHAISAVGRQPGRQRDLPRRAGPNGVICAAALMADMARATPNYADHSASWPTMHNI